MVVLFIVHGLPHHVTVFAGVHHDHTWLLNNLTMMMLMAVSKLVFSKLWYSIYRMSPCCGRRAIFRRGSRAPSPFATAFSGDACTASIVFEHLSRVGMIRDWIIHLVCTYFTFRWLLIVTSWDLTVYIERISLFECVVVLHEKGLMLGQLILCFYLIFACISSCISTLFEVLGRILRIKLVCHLVKCRCRHALSECHSALTSRLQPQLTAARGHFVLSEAWSVLDALDDSAAFAFWELCLAIAVTTDERSSRLLDQARLRLAGPDQEVSLIIVVDF